jgi:superfamily I DNA/RNA helicase/RecB family exonuclease
VTAGAYTLVRRHEPPGTAPQLDPHQQAVVDHRGGPLLVLAGPGTGKTTTLVEAVVDRIAYDRVPPGEILVLTFSRKAAAELRERITARLGKTTIGPTASTFHSFCYGLVRQHQPADAYVQPLRLLSAPEQEVIVRDLLAGSLEAGRVEWPAMLMGCLETRGLSAEVRDVIARTRSLAMDPADLLRIGKRTDEEETWQALASFVDEYLDVLDSQGAIDYAELVHRAVLLAESAAIRAELRQRFSVVFVDEYQDTDAAQVRLLQAIAGHGRELVVVGDPDQSIYRFRGADLRGILDFPQSFRRRDDSPAPVSVLRVSRRAGPTLLAASRRVAARLPLPGLPATAVRDHRELIAAAGPAGASAAPGGRADRVEVFTYPSLGAELESVADLLRRAHLEDGVPWSEMAVLVRSGRRSIAVTRRVLGAAGVPLEVAGDELPLPAEPAVAPLLLALRCAADPGALTVDAARSLLLSPLGGADASDVRRLGRALRAQERAAVSDDGGSLSAVRPSAELIREAVAAPENLVALEDRVARPAVQLATVLAKARKTLASTGSAEQALWTLWAGTPWPRRLARHAERGGAIGRRADRDLDAICALFHAAARAEERSGHRGPLNFIAEVEAQQIPADTLAETGVRGDGVRLLTAHRSKGLEWRLVIVTGVQEEVWPDLRRRGSLLQVDRISPEGLEPPPTLASLLAEERRLFYVAVTRARERLVVTAVRSPHDDGDQPSRFLDELGVQPTAVEMRPMQPLTLAGLVAELRANSVDPSLSRGVRAAAASRLAELASAIDEDGDPLAPFAHPDRWWGLAELTDPGQPVRDPGQPLRLSPSAVEGLHDCPRRWFLQREVHADTSRSMALGFGSVVHALAKEVADGVTPADPDALLERLDKVWGQLAFEARWQSPQQREEARQAVIRFLTWHAAHRGRTVLTTEHWFDVMVDLPSRGDPVQVRLTGQMDRVEQDSEGKAWIVDFKTGKNPPTRTEIDRHVQLGVYQVASRAGALDGLSTESGGAAIGGAELVHLRKDESRNTGHPKVQPQTPIEFAGDGAPNWVQEALLHADGLVRAEQFPARLCRHCGWCEFRSSCPAQPEGRQVIE